MAASPDGGLYTNHGVAVPPRSEVLFSIDNENQRFRYVAGVSALFGGRALTLRVGGAELSSSSYGHSNGDHSVSFDIDAPTAHALAQQRGIPLAERTRLGDGLEGTFVAGEWHVGGPLPISLDLAYRGEPIDLVVGGRQRGPRNDRFSFVVSRDGQELPVITAHNFGGLSTVHNLEAGMVFSLEVDAVGWVAITEPGTYSVRCRYEGELWAPGRYIDPWPDGRHLTWDLVIEQTIQVTVY